MKLSAAMVLGDSLKRATGMSWLRQDGCGCAIGGALLATGCTFEDYKKVEEKVSDEEKNKSPKGWLAETECIKSRWPWVTARNLSIISLMYDEVIAGRCTIETIVDYVSKIEPQEIEEQNSADAVQDQRTLVA